MGPVRVFVLVEVCTTEVDASSSVVLEGGGGSTSSPEGRTYVLCPFAGSATAPQMDMVQPKKTPLSSSLC